MRRSGTSTRWWAPALLLAGGLVGWGWGQRQFEGPPSRETGLERAAVSKFITRYCSDCHNGDVKRGGLDLDGIKTEGVGAHPKVWEKVARKLAARQMPPAGKPRPDEKTYESFVATLEADLDRAAAVRPDPGRTPTWRR